MPPWDTDGERLVVAMEYLGEHLQLVTRGVSLDYDVQLFASVRLRLGTTCEANHEWFSCLPV